MTELDYLRLRIDMMEQAIGMILHLDINTDEDQPLAMRMPRNMKAQQILDQLGSDSDLIHQAYMEANPHLAPATEEEEGDASAS